MVLSNGPVCDFGNLRHAIRGGHLCERSASLSLSRRPNLQLSEYGYQSPLPLNDAQYERRLASGWEGISTMSNGISQDVSVKSGLELHINDSGLPQPESEQQLGSGEEVQASKKIGFRDRVGCYTWTWFSMTMATGGIANVLHSIPYRPEWLRIIGATVFLFNIILFLMNCIFLTLRFKWNPGSFKASFISQLESLFIPTCVVSAGIILINICQYGLPMTEVWFQTTMQICFWAYAGIAILSSSGMYLLIWSTQAFPIHMMTPIWIFPAYPLLLITSFASNLIDALPDLAAAERINSIAIAFGAVTIQGIGFFVSLTIYSAFIYRLMTQKLLREATQPSMFVSVGPPGLTVTGIVHLGNVALHKIMPGGYAGEPRAALFLKLLSDMAGLWLWGLCLWFFIISAGAHWRLVRRNGSKYRVRFDMTWYSFVFPNTALVSATHAIGRAFNSDAIEIFGTVLACILIVTWIVIFATMIRAILLKRLLWPEKVGCSKKKMKCEENGVVGDGGDGGVKIRNERA